MLKKLIGMSCLLMISVNFTWQTKVESVVGNYGIEKENGEVGVTCLTLEPDHSCRWTNNGFVNIQMLGKWKRRETELILTWQYNRLIDNSEINSFYDHKIKGIKVEVYNDSFQPITNTKVIINNNEAILKNTNTNGVVEFLEEDFQKTGVQLPNYIENIVLDGQNLSRYYSIEKENINVCLVIVNKSPQTILAYKTEYYQILNNRLIKSGNGVSIVDFDKLYPNLTFRKL